MSESELSAEECAAELRREVERLTEENARLKSGELLPGPTALEAGADVDGLMDDFAAKYADSGLNLVLADNIRQADEIADLQMRARDASRLLDEMGVATADDVGEWTLARRIRDLGNRAPAPPVEQPACNCHNHIQGTIGWTCPYHGTLRPEQARQGEQPDLDLDAIEARLNNRPVSAINAEADAWLLLTEVRRLRSEPAPTGAAGTWPWALEQMKAGKRVRLGEFPKLGSIGFYTGLFLMFYDGDNPENGVVVRKSWFEATDWQLSPTEGEK